MKEQLVIKKKELKKPMSIGATDSEKRIISDAAKKAGVNMSDYMIACSMHFAK